MFEIKRTSDVFPTNVFLPLYSPPMFFPPMFFPTTVFPINVLPTNIFPTWQAGAEPMFSPPTSCLNFSFSLSSIAKRRDISYISRVILRSFPNTILSFYNIALKCLPIYEIEVSLTDHIYHHLVGDLFIITWFSLVSSSM